MPIPIVLLTTYTAISAVWQFAFWYVYPNVGMGSLGIVYIVWPVLGLSIVALWTSMRSAKNHRIMAFCLFTLIMLALTLLIHPKNTWAVEQKVPFAVLVALCSRIAFFG